MEKSKIKNILEWINCIIIAIILALLFRYYIGTPTIVRMSSMYPTLIACLEPCIYDTILQNKFVLFYAHWPL